MSGMEGRVFVYRKPFASDIILYKTLTAAWAACIQIDGEIQEWVALDGADRMVLTRTWRRTSQGIVLVT